MKARELIKDIKAKKIAGGENPDLSGLAVDSRRVRPGFLYIAVRGEKDDGHRHIAQAIERGAKAVVSEKEIEPPGRTLNIVVENSREALSRLAGAFYGHPDRKLKLVGITGTNGKTTTSYIIESIVAAAGLRSGVIGTINYRVANRQVPALNTTPGPLEIHEILAQMVEARCQYAIMEVSSHGLAQNRVAGLSFDACIFTNVTPHEHLDYHGTFRNYLAVKATLFSVHLARSGKENRLAVINRDDPAAGLMVRSVPPGVKIITCGFRRRAMVRGGRLSAGGKGIRLQVKTFAGPVDATLALPGRHNAYNLLSAVAFGLGSGFPPETVRRGIEELKTVPGRFEEVETDRGFRVIVDYAHTDTGLKHLLLTARSVRLATPGKPGRIVLVFGCGGDRDRNKRPKMGRVAALYADHVVLTSDNPRSEDPPAIIEQVRSGMTGAGRHCCDVIPDRQEAINRAIALAREGDVVLIAGKGHETYQILKDTVIPFDDRLAARKALAALGGGAG